MRRVSGILRLGLGILLLLAGCESAPEPLPPVVFKPLPPPTPFSKSEALQQFDAAPLEAYRIGEGDGVTFQVWDHPELTVTQAVGPDGVVTLPVAGPMRVSGMSREEAAKAVRAELLKFF